MPQEIADDVYEKRLAHSKVVYLADERLLIDTGPDSEWAGLQSFLDDHEGVERLFLSHAHSDHVGNVDRVVETYEPEVLYPENEPLDDVPLTEDDVQRVEDETDLGEDARFLEVPGHTEGIGVVVLPDRKTLLATDVLDGADRRGLPAGYLLPPPVIYNWDSYKAATNIERLLNLEFETAVVTHGSNVDSSAREKLDKYLNFPDHYRQNLIDG